MMLIARFISDTIHYPRVTSESACPTTTPNGFIEVQVILFGYAHTLTVVVCAGTCTRTDSLIHFAHRKTKVTACTAAVEG